MKLQKSLQANNSSQTLIVVTGPTASGKTALAVDLATSLGCDIISADSRQIYRGLPIGTATPTEEEMKGVKHHLLSFLSLEEYYNAARFEKDVLRLLHELWKENQYVILCGGSMMYIDAVLHGIDELPDISSEIRESTVNIYQEKGLSYMLDWLTELDPDYASVVDRTNWRRVIHAIEICREAGVPYSTLRTGCSRSRPWHTVIISPYHSRERLFDRINSRVEHMVHNGLVEEARKVNHLRHLNSLNTVGYKELFAYFDGKLELNEAIARIAKNTRVYAKKQLTWMKKIPEVHYVSADSNILHETLRIITSTK